MDQYGNTLCIPHYPHVTVFAVSNSVALFCQESDTAWIALTSSISDGDLLLEQTAAGLVDSSVYAALQELTNEKVGITSWFSYVSI